MRLKNAIASCTLLAAALPALASVNLLTFEGLEDQSDADSLSMFYADKGISFAGSAMAFKSTQVDANFAGNFYGAPTMPTALGLFGDGLPGEPAGLLINVADGFSNLIALHSVLDGRSASVSLFSDINGGGTSLGGFDIAALDQSGCDVGFVCAWSSNSYEFQGLAKSIFISGFAASAYFDNIQLGRDTTQPPNGVPEPGALALVMAGFGAALFGRRRKAGSKA